MNKVLNLTYSSSLSNICEVNTSFDSGVLRIAYAGENRNKSYISKETFEKCIKTIYNCPIVCSYNREEDSIGGHDMDVVRGNDGTLRLVNITTPIGCIPESANIYWQTVEEEDGTTHEYLCADALLWKRQEAYQKIKNDGYSAQSMEITVKDGRKNGDIYNIFDFEFTAFALIGVEPCFESAALEFSKQDFKQQLSQMMTEIKETFSNAKPSFEDSIINAGKRKEEIMLKEKMELAAKYGINTDELEFSMLDFSLEELEEKFKEIKSLADNDGKNQNGGENFSIVEGKFAIESNIKEEICRVLSSERVTKEWGDYARYVFVDYDRDAKCVYFCDTEDWLLYGCEFTINKDEISINFECKKRKKYEIVDFEGTEQDLPISDAFNLMENSVSELSKKYKAAMGDVESMKSELEELREFKKNTESAKLKEQRDNVFSKFSELEGIEEFDALKNNCESLDIVALEDKCFAIRGRNIKVDISPIQNSSPKLIVKGQNNSGDSSDEPYGGVFLKYGIIND